MRLSLHAAAALAVLAAATAGCAEPEDAGQAAVLELEPTDTTGIIVGVVVDDRIVPVAGATVQLRGAGRNATTNADGSFGFEGVEPGLHFLEASHPRHEAVQQSVDVVAGKADPEPVRFLLARIPGTEPYIVAQEARMFIDGAVAVAGSTVTAGGFLTEGSFVVEVPVDPGARAVQVELRWEPTSQTGLSIEAAGALYANGTEEPVLLEEVRGVSPLILRLLPAPGDAVDRLVVDITADREEDVSVFANQPVDAYIHAFHHFLPRPDWEFGRDGEHPVPEG